MKVKNELQKTSEAAERAAYNSRLSEWKEKQQHKDVKLLANLSGVSTVTISKAINKGVGSLKLLRIIDSFYSSRKK